MKGLPNLSCQMWHTRPKALCTVFLMINAFPRVRPEKTNYVCKIGGEGTRGGGLLPTTCNHVYVSVYVLCLFDQISIHATACAAAAGRPRLPRRVCSGADPKPILPDELPLLWQAAA